MYIVIVIVVVEFIFSVSQYIAQTRWKHKPIFCSYGKILIQTTCSLIARPIISLKNLLLLVALHKPPSKQNV